MKVDYGQQDCFDSEIYLYNINVRLRFFVWHSFCHLAFDYQKNYFLTSDGFFSFKCEQLMYPKGDPDTYNIPNPKGAVRTAAKPLFLNHDKPF